MTMFVYLLMACTFFIRIRPVKFDCTIPDLLDLPLLPSSYLFPNLKRAQAYNIKFFNADCYLNICLSHISLLW